MGWLIKGGRIVDPANHLDRVMDLRIEEGRVAEVGEKLERRASDRVLDANGLVVAPGLIDMHAHFREPGHEEKEDIETGSKAAVMGGYTTVACMANTDPVCDNAAVVRYVIERGKQVGLCDVLPIGAVSKGLKGEELAEMADMAKAGAVAFSDDGRPVTSASLMMKALQYSQIVKKPVISHAEDVSLSSGTSMHFGRVSTRLGLRGVPSAGEESIVMRDVMLCREVGGKLHLAHLSSAWSVRFVRWAKANGLRFTAEATPHHLSLDHDYLLEHPYDTNAKVNPPLRAPEDRAEVCKGLSDGTIDVIATDHAPHCVDDKDLEFDQAAFGISGLETALPVCYTTLVQDMGMSLSSLITKMSLIPAQILGLDSVLRGTLTPGARADIVIFDPHTERVVDVGEFQSKGHNTPFAGSKLRGWPVHTFYKGNLVMTERRLA
ncbi:MAG TPA: dihydroorotase [Firmicutes bacterium]|nr:dihydroorotase [Bacillota bacterium]